MPVPEERPMTMIGCREKCKMSGEKNMIRYVIPNPASIKKANACPDRVMTFLLFLVQMTLLGKIPSPPDKGHDRHASKGS